jgi:hypothetical protein
MAKRREVLKMLAKRHLADLGVTGWFVCGIMTQKCVGESEYASVSLSIPAGKNL